ncbi:MAG: hypothetical protein U1F63_16905 [Chitinivorax sp.]
MSFLGNIGKALGGGNIMGLALGAASMFFPPLGLASAAMGNLLGNAVGQALGSAVGQMVQHLGLPQQIAQQVHQIVDKALQGVLKEVNQQAQEAVSQKFEGVIKQFIDQLSQEIFKKVRENAGNTAGGAAGGAAAGGAAAGGAAAGGASWFVQIAIALGEASDKQMGKVKGLADQLNAAVNGSGSENDKKFNALGSQMNAEAKVLDMLTSTMNNAVNSIGDALKNAAKHQ